MQKKFYYVKVMGEFSPMVYTLKFHYVKVMGEFLLNVFVV